MLMLLSKRKSSIQLSWHSSSCWHKFQLMLLYSDRLWCCYIARTRHGDQFHLHHKHGWNWMPLCTNWERSTRHNVDMWEVNRLHSWEKMVIETDHKPLVQLLTKKQGHSRVNGKKCTYSKTRFDHVQLLYCCSHVPIERDTWETTPGASGRGGWYWKFYIMIYKGNTSRYFSVFC